jgi:putative membrane protein
LGQSTAAARARRTLNIWTALAGVAGAILAVALVMHYGVRPVIELLVQAGFGILVVISFHFLQLWLTALAWGALIPRAAPTAWLLALLRMIREGINNLLPVAGIGGPVIGVRLLARCGVATADAVAATVVDITVELVTQVVFTLLGLAMLVEVLGEFPLAAPLLIGLAVVAAMVVALVAAQRLGLARIASRAAERFGWTHSVMGVQEAILGLYRRKASLAWSAALHMLAWALGAVEVWLAMHFLGNDIGLAEALVIESLGQTIKAASFAIPGALGVQEGGYVVLCGLFGIAPDLALALSLIKRLREIVVGAPSIFLWLWLERGGAVGLARDHDGDGRWLGSMARRPAANPPSPLP